MGRPMSPAEAQYLGLAGPAGNDTGVGTRTLSPEPVAPAPLMPGVPLQEPQSASSDPGFFGPPQGFTAPQPVAPTQAPQQGSYYQPDVAVPAEAREKPLAERFAESGIPLVEDIGWLNLRMGEGIDNAAVNGAYFWAATGAIPIEDAMEMERRALARWQSPEMQALMQENNYASRSLGAAAQMLPQMLIGMSESLIGGAVGGTAAGPGGAKAGGKAGGLQYWYRAGAGEIFKTGLQEGLHPNIARTVAFAGAIPYAGIEQSQVIDRALAKFGGGEASKTLGGAFRKYLTNVGIESAQEGAQASIKRFSLEIGKHLQNALIQDGQDLESLDAAEMIQAMGSDFWDDFVSSIGPLAIISGPGGSMDAANAVFRQQEQQEGNITNEEEQPLGPQANGFQVGPRQGQGFAQDQDGWSPPDGGQGQQVAQAQDVVEPVDVAVPATRMEFTEQDVADINEATPTGAGQVDSPNRPPQNQDAQPPLALETPEQFAGRKMRERQPRRDTRAAAVPSERPGPVERDPEVRTRNFRRWFGKSRVVDDRGEALPVFHGSTHVVTSFNGDRGNPENNLGLGYYFSDNANDVASNYATTEGGDLTARIDNEFDRIYNQMQVDAAERGEVLTKDRLDQMEEEAQQQARQRISGEAPNTMKVYLKMENPFIIHRANSERETWTEEQVSDFIGEVASEADRADPMSFDQHERFMVGLWENLEDAVSGYQDNFDRSPEYDAAMVFELVRRNNQLNDVINENGESMSAEVMRQAIENLGYDGIIDRRVGERFKNMPGMTQGTSHYIAFRPEQIKSATGNTGAFDGTNRDVRAGEARGQGDYLDNQVVTQEQAAQIVKGFGRTGKDLEVNVVPGEAPNITTEEGLLYEPGSRVRRAAEQARAEGRPDTGIRKAADIELNSGQVNLYEGATVASLMEEALHWAFDPRSGLFSEMERKVIDKRYQDDVGGEAFSHDALKWAAKNEKPRGILERAYQRFADFLRDIQIAAGLQDMTIEDVYRRALRGQTRGAGQRVRSPFAERRAAPLELPDVDVPRTAKLDESLEQTYAEDDTVGIIVSPKPGEFDGRGPAPRNPNVPTPRFEQLHREIPRIFKTPELRSLVKDLTGFDGELKATPIWGSWLGDPEPSFVVDGDGMTFEQANEIAKLLGFMMAQEAVFATKPAYGDPNSFPAIYATNGTKISTVLRNRLTKEAKARGLDYSLSKDGKAVKFFYLSFDTDKSHDEYASDVVELLTAVGFKNIGEFDARSEYNGAEDYRSGGAGESQEAGSPSATLNSPGLFRRGVDAILVPWQESIRAAGYTFDPKRFGDVFGLTEEEQAYLDQAVAPASAPVAKGWASPGYNVAPSPDVASQPDTRFGEARIGPRNPTAQSSVEYSGDDVRVGMAEALQNPELLEKQMGLVTEPGVARLEGKSVVGGYPNYRPTPQAQTPQQQAERFVNHMVRNLLALYDAVPPQVRERSKRWYVGGQRLARKLEAQYPITKEQAAGVIAALSPQRDWFVNVAMAERLIDMYYNARNAQWNDDIAGTLARISNSANTTEVAQRINGKNYAEIPKSDRKGRALWLRAYSETYHDPAYHLVTPEGERSGYALGVDGETPKSIQWSSMEAIASGLDILDNGDIANINEVVSQQHKVRSFYNNIVNPFSDRGEVTIDTHAVAAAQLQPLAADDEAVLNAFGKNHKGRRGPGADKRLGTQGLYPLYAEAYRRAAEKRGVLPREMQSITWEAGRGLFADKWKRPANKQAVLDVWQRFQDGKLTQPAAVRQVMEMAGGIDNPPWFQEGVEDDYTRGITPPSELGALPGPPEMRPVQEELHLEPSLAGAARSAGEAIASGAMAARELLGGDRLGIQPQAFNEESFRRAIPYLKQAWESAKAAGIEFGAWASAMARVEGDWIKPYLTAFEPIKDQEAPDPTGRPDLAQMGSSDAERDLTKTLDDRREAQRQGEQPMDFVETREEARRTVQEDREGVKATLMAKEDQGQLLDAQETAEAQALAESAMRQALETNNLDDLTEAAAIHHAYRNRRTETARALAIGYDAEKTRQERQAEVITDAVMWPDKDVKKQLDKKDAEIEKLRQQLERLKRDIQKKDPENISGQLEEKKRELRNAKDTLKRRDEAKAKDKIARAQLRSTIKQLEAEVKRLQGKLDSMADIQGEVRRLRQTINRRDKAIEQRDELLRKQAIAMQRMKDELLKQGIDLGNLVEQMDQPRDAAKVIRAVSAARADNWDKLHEYWLNAILSGPGTHLVNVTGTLGNGILEMGVLQPMQAMLNVIARDPMAPQLGEFRHMLKAMGPGLARAGRNLIEAYATDRPVLEEQAGGKAHQKIESLRGPAIGGNLGRGVRLTGTTTLVAMDEFFKSLFGEMEAAAMAYRLGKDAGLEGEALTRFMQEQTNDLASDSWQYGIDKAVDFAFQRPLDQDNAALKGLMYFRKAFGMRYIIPFVTTPYNVFASGLKLTPLKAGHMAYRIAKKRGTYDKKDAVKDMSELILASALTMALASLLGGDDDEGEDERPLITGTMPWRSSSKGDRALAMRTAPPMSIWNPFEGEYRSYARIEPMATALSATVDMLNLIKATGQGQEMGKTIADLFAHLGGQVEEKTFLAGIGDIIEISRDTDRAAPRWLARFASSWIPNLLRQPVRTVGDSHVRESGVWGESMSEEFFDRLGRRVAFQALPAASNPMAPRPKVTPWGEEVEKNIPTGIMFSDFVTEVFMRSSNLEARDPMALELDRMYTRWNEQNPNERTSPGLPAVFYTQNGETHYWTDDEYHKLNVLRGRRAMAMLTTRFEDGTINTQVPTENDIKQVGKALDTGREWAKKIVRRYPDYSLDQIWAEFGDSLHGAAPTP